MAVIRKRATSGGGLNVNFQKVADAIRKDMQAHMSDAVREGFREIVAGTPRDTGYAQSNWKILFANVKVSALPPKDKSQQYPGVDEVMAREELKFQFIQKDGFNTGFRFNNETPYIYELERGHDPKRGFVQRGMTRMKIELEKTMKKRTKVK